MRERILPAGIGGGHDVGGRLDARGTPAHAPVPGGASSGVQAGGRACIAPWCMCAYSGNIPLPDLCRIGC